jgi:hypothetical protein
VKPDNIIVKRTLGDEVHVTLLDLGFAWVPPERNLTGVPEPTRQVFGTDRFIAPELGVETHRVALKVFAFVMLHWRPPSPSFLALLH